jgi:hypothetical protein
MQPRVRVVEGPLESDEFRGCRQVKTPGSTLNPFAKGGARSVRRALLSRSRGAGCPEAGASFARVAAPGDRPQSRFGAGGGIYQLTQHGVATFSEALRREVPARQSARRGSSPEPPRASSSPISGRSSAASCLPPALRSLRRRTSPTRSPTSSSGDRDTWRSTRCWFARRSKCASARQPLELARRRPGPNLADPAPSHLLTALTLCANCERLR